MDPRAAALPLAASRIAESHFPKACRPGLDIAGFGVVEEFKLQSPQRVFKPERRNPFGKDGRLNEG
jgi:hypothetical protein